MSKNGNENMLNLGWNFTLILFAMEFGITDIVGVNKGLVSNIYMGRRWAKIMKILHITTINNY